MKSNILYGEWQVERRFEDDRQPVDGRESADSGPTAKPQKRLFRLASQHGETNPAISSSKSAEAANP